MDGTRDCIGLPHDSIDVNHLTFEIEPFKLCFYIFPALFISFFFVYYVQIDCMRIHNNWTITVFVNNRLSISDIPID